MKPFWSTIALSSIIAIAVLVIQQRNKDAMANKIEAVRSELNREQESPEHSRARSISQNSGSTTSSGLAQSGSATIEERVATARARLQTTFLEIDNSPVEIFKMLPELLEVIKDFDTDELLALATNLEQSMGMSECESTARNFIFRIIAEHDPEKLLSNKELLESDPEVRKAVLSAALRKSPQHLLDLMDEMEINDSDKQNYRKAAALQMMEDDPATAFGILRESGLGRETVPSNGIPALAKAIDDPANQDIREGLVAMLLRSELYFGGVEGARSAVEEFDLPEKDVANYLSGYPLELGNSPIKGIQWAKEALSDELAATTIGEIVAVWSNRDYGAVAEWLIDESPSPARDIAIDQFTEKVLGIDPPGAATWALEISREPQRASSLARIYSRWSEQDPEAANAWFSEHGLQTPEQNPD